MSKCELDELGWLLSRTYVEVAQIPGWNGMYAREQELIGRLRMLDVSRALDMVRAATEIRRAKGEWA